MKFHVKSCKEAWGTYFVHNEKGGGQRQMEYGYICELGLAENRIDIFNAELFIVTFKDPPVVGSIIEL